MELSSSNIKKIIIFSQNKAFLIFQKIETSKKLFIFQETELSYIPGNRNPKKTSYILRSSFPNSKNEKVPYISGYGTFLYFRR